jgi:hypothetical protein
MQCMHCIFLALFDQRRCVFSLINYINKINIGITVDVLELHYHKTAENYDSLLEKKQGNLEEIGSKVLII